MKIGKFIIRKPFGRYVSIEFEEEVYWEMRRSILDDLLKETMAEIENLHK